MSAPRRFLAAGLVVAALEGALAVLALPTGLSPYLFACAVTSAVVALVAHKLLVRRPDDPGEGRGGSGTPSDDPPPPPWWPQFEADFRAHVRARERARPYARS